MLKYQLQSVIFDSSPFSSISGHPSHQSALHLPDPLQRFVHVGPLSQPEGHGLLRDVRGGGGLAPGTGSSAARGPELRHHPR